MGIHENLYRQGFYRARQGRLLGGVCAGLARKLGMDPWLARVLVFILLVVVPGSPLILYPIMWIVMPDEGAFTWGGEPRA